MEEEIKSHLTRSLLSMIHRPARHSRRRIRALPAAGFTRHLPLLQAAPAPVPARLPSRRRGGSPLTYTRGGYLSRPAARACPEMFRVV